LAQAKQRKIANLAKQEVLRKQRQEALGDPIRGISTPFLEAFDNVGGSADLIDVTSTNSAGNGTRIKADDDVLLNHFLKPSELQESLQHSQVLTEPIVNKERYSADPAKELEEQQRWMEGHARAAAAMARIASLANASRKDKTRANIRRCIETFGRHNTDSTLRPRASVNRDIYRGENTLPEKTPRAGPDTGSSEVQVAILTAKIRVLANHLETRGGKKDKVNKRNLRILVHKRQKHLKYLRTKERGSDRWQNLIQKLGLTEGTWKGEISL
jgi:ribosomal protein S15